jgi:hypothetical protein
LSDENHRQLFDIVLTSIGIRAIQKMPPKEAASGPYDTD